MTLNNNQSEWQLQTAKAQFSQVVNRALRSGPQLITKAGRPAVYVISAELFETEFASKTRDRKNILLSSPHQDTFLNLDRDPAEGREVEV
ncbi:MAG: type II toxin-antitoxin system Phd/YefM family antitoxin [Lentisphaerae bacterium]|jgi:prevent-host-death family protein|nr:type II toxin-antitoxin system Phd/YefM family antitoxin [Lentisphaerota bacterium]